MLPGGQGAGVGVGVGGQDEPADDLHSPETLKLQDISETDITQLTHRIASTSVSILK